MNKFVKSLMCVAMCFGVGGCFSFSNMYTRTDKNVFSECGECVSVSSVSELLSNVELVMRDVDVISGEYYLKNTKQEINIDFDVIVKDKRVDWDLYADVKMNDKDIEVYFKDGKFYVVYPNNNANVVIKDSIYNLFLEANDSLDALNATYNKEGFEDLMLGDKLSGFDFTSMKETATYTRNNDGTYLVRYAYDDLVWEYDISTNYLIEKVRCSASNFSSTLDIDYPDTVSIVYPMSLDFLTLDIKEVKELLKVNNFAELIDEDLKK